MELTLKLKNDELLLICIEVFFLEQVKYIEEQNIAKQLVQIKSRQK